jgi:H+/Cl- antiporter ClcA
LIPPVNFKMKRSRTEQLRRITGMLLNNPHTASLRANLLKGIPLWIASLVTGFVAIVYTRLFSIAESAFHSLRSWNPLSIFILTPLSFVAAFLLVRFFAPNATGSGIPQVMATLEPAARKKEGFIDDLLSVRIVLTKIFSSLLMVQGGGAIGREGPTIQIASSIFRIVEKFVPKSWPKVSSPNYIITGAAAGLAAAFNTPLGGIVFAIEELAKIHIRFFRTSLFVAVIIAGLTAQAILGPYLYLGYPPVAGNGIMLFILTGAVGVMAGFAGAAMCRLILAIRKLKSRFGTTQLVMFALLSGLATASLGYFFNEAIFGSGKELMNSLLFTSNKHIDVGTSLSRIVGSAISFNSGAAGGIFAPSLAAGASIGSLMSAWLGYFGGDANVLILCGMVGFLTGVTRTPFTSAILVLEMTDRHGVIFQLMFAALMANVAGLMIMKHSLYEVLKRGFTRPLNNPEPTSII